VVDDDNAASICKGISLTLDENGVDTTDVTAPDLCRAYSRDGRFLAMLQYLPEKEVWKPKKVLG